MINVVYIFIISALFISIIAISLIYIDSVMFGIIIFCYTTEPFGNKCVFYFYIYTKSKFMRYFYFFRPHALVFYRSV